MKRRVLALVLTVLILAAGVLAAGKLYSMYRNVWSVLNDLQASAARVDSLSAQVDRLYRQAYSPAEPVDDSWIDYVYIAHACGGIDGIAYTNSREAFLQNYQLGQRVFEIDLNLTTDGMLAAVHDEESWRDLIGDDDLPFTGENFNQTPLLSQYESLNCSELIDLMVAYPDVYIVTDTKSTSQSEVMLAFSQLVYCAEETDPEVLRRIIPQIYGEEMLSWVTGIYPFSSVIYTLYQVPDWTAESVLNFCMNSGVRFVTVPDTQITQEAIRLWDTVGIHTGVHTVNDKDEAQALLDMGVDMIYTDELIFQ